MSVWHDGAGLVRWILLYTAKILILCIALRFVSVRHVGVSSARWCEFGTLGSVRHVGGYLARCYCSVGTMHRVNGTMKFQDIFSS